MTKAYAAAIANRTYDKNHACVAVVNGLSEVINLGKDMKTANTARSALKARIDGKKAGGLVFSVEAGVTKVLLAYSKTINRQVPGAYPMGPHGAESSLFINTDDGAFAITLLNHIIDLKYARSMYDGGPIFDKLVGVQEERYNSELAQIENSFTPNPRFNGCSFGNITIGQPPLGWAPVRTPLWDGS